MNNRIMNVYTVVINPLHAELNPICHLLALLGAHHILHVSRIRVKLITVQNCNYRSIVVTRTYHKLIYHHLNSIPTQIN